jgi:hypothetical protein
MIPMYMICRFKKQLQPICGKTLQTVTRLQKEEKLVKSRQHTTQRYDLAGNYEYLSTEKTRSKYF